MKINLKTYLPLLISVCFFMDCNSTHLKPDQSIFIEEVKKSEKDFCDMARNESIEKAFYSFAAEDATIKRSNDSLIHGRDAIGNFYSDPKYKTAHVTWAPDFVQVSDDGTLAYTYGKYEWVFNDSTGEKKYTGIFHTVWKKMKDGKWKFVWD
jgi:ketosteroid isomerase-like protein